jgi:hypothetical protein
VQDNVKKIVDYLNIPLIILKNKHDDLKDKVFHRKEAEIICNKDHQFMK